MNKLKFCRVCLNTKSVLFNGSRFHLKEYYDNFINGNDNMLGSKVEIPYDFCSECSMLLYKTNKFKEKCKLSQKLLKDIISEGTLTESNILHIDRKKLQLESTLTIVEPLFISVPYQTENTFSPPESPPVDVTQFKSEIIVETEPSPTEHKSLPEIIDSTLFKNECDKTFETDELDDLNKSAKKKTEVRESIKNEKTSNKKDSEKKIKKVKTKKKEKVKYAKQRSFGHTFDPQKWKVVHLTKSEMIEEFNKRKESEKTEHHCEYCYSNFRCEDTLKRHIRVHSEELGRFVCFLCKRRYRWEGTLRKHMKFHNIKYHCLKCLEVFNNSGEAKQHERSHDGVIYQCKDCTAKFTKKQTYYTHVRTHHRSSHVCSACGASFVSRVGLRLHLRKTHLERAPQINSDDDKNFDKTKETHCDKCNITFQTLSAYDEHLKNSAMHIDEFGLNVEMNAKPILFRSTTESKKVMLDEEISCTQCSQKFFTSQSYERHVSVKHEGRRKRPRPYRRVKNSDEIRYICEICGVNLAAGSRTLHKRMHDGCIRQNKEFPCDTCGKVFKSAWNRKQHITTHTGEKPYSCKLCDKKFTQQQGASKHFRTCHMIDIENGAK